MLPKVIAENLFPSKEDDKTTDIFSAMINYDLELRKFYEAAEQLEIEHNEDIVPKENTQN